MINCEPHEDCGCIQDFEEKQNIRNKKDARNSCLKKIVLDLQVHLRCIAGAFENVGVDM